MSKQMKNSDIVKRVCANNIDLDEHVVKRVIAETTFAILESIGEGNRVVITRFGAFNPRKVKGSAVSPIDNKKYDFVRNSFSFKISHWARRFLNGKIE